MTTVTKKFRDDFEVWATYNLTQGNWTHEDMTEFKAMLRKDLAPGPDLLRAGLTVLIAEVMEVPVTIDNCEDRHQLWADYFAAEASAIRALITD